MKQMAEENKRQPENLVKSLEEILRRVPMATTA
jgi:hypothetical protein